MYVVIIISAIMKCKPKDSAHPVRYRIQDLYLPDMPHSRRLLLQNIQMCIRDRSNPCCPGLKSDSTRTAITLYNGTLPMIISGAIPAVP